MQKLERLHKFVGNFTNWLENIELDEKKLKLAGKLPESNCRMRSCSFFSSSLTQNLNYFSSCCSSQNMVNWISPKLLIFF